MRPHTVSYRQVKGPVAMVARLVDFVHQWGTDIGPDCVLTVAGNTRAFENHLPSLSAL